MSNEQAKEDIKAIQAKDPQLKDAVKETIQELKGNTSQDAKVITGMLGTLDRIVAQHKNRQELLHEIAGGPPEEEEKPQE